MNRTYEVMYKHYKLTTKEVQANQYQLEKNSKLTRGNAGADNSSSIRNSSSNNRLGNNSSNGNNSHNAGVGNINDKFIQNSLFDGTNCVNMESHKIINNNNNKNSSSNMIKIK